MKYPIKDFEEYHAINFCEECIKEKSLMNQFNHDDFYIFLNYPQEVIMDTTISPSIITKRRTTSLELKPLSESMKYVL